MSKPKPEFELNKIESGVPMPTTRGRKGWTELIGSMKVGDSFVTDQVVSNLYIYAAWRNFKLASRAIQGTNLRRIWRVS